MSTLLQDPAWRRGFALLGQHQLAYDLQAPPPLMPDAARLAADFPDTTLVLTHCGLPLDKSPEDVDLWEINEAFASVAINSVRMLGIDEEKVNVNGGAIALGHPIGASGARILGSLVLELRRRGGGLGCAAICSGGGQGDAVIVEVNGG